MRELEGLSYREIGERMGMSRPAVESTLFRARRRLTEEYGELVSGERCRRVQSIIAWPPRARSARATRAGSRAMSRTASRAGARRWAPASTASSSPVRPCASAWPPRWRASCRSRPSCARRRGGGAGDDGGVVSGGGAAWASHLPAISDQLSAGWTKVAAGVAILLAGVGAGVGVQHGVPAHATPAARAHGAAASGPASAASAAAGKPAARYAGDARARSLRPARDGAAPTARTGLRSSPATNTFAPQVRRSAPAAGSGGGSAAQKPAARPRRTTPAPTGTPAATLPRTAPKPVRTVATRSSR